MWMVEGSVSEDDVGEGYLGELIERCMVQVGRTSSYDGRVKTYQMHDLMRDLCLSNAKEENFLESIDGTFQQVETSSSSMVTKLSIVDKVRRRAIYLDESPLYQSVAEARAVSNNKNEEANIYVRLNPKMTHPADLF